MRTDSIVSEDVSGLITLASRAPSLHNSQPWRFRDADGVIELRADPARGLRLADPSSRELVISCGAALTNLEVGVRALGLSPRVRLLPVPADRQLLATVCGGPGRQPAPAELTVLAAITHRHSHRGAFSPVRPSDGVLAELRQAAAVHGARLTIIPAGAGSDELRRLAWLADDAQHQVRGWAAETVSWAAQPGCSRRDGVPATAYSALADRSGSALPARDFSCGQAWGRGDPPAAGGSVLAVLTTAGDHPVDWLLAGRALQYVLLRAASEWLFASFTTQPLELPDLRAAVGRTCRLNQFPQMLFRLGYTSVTPQTPRRPVHEVLTRG